MKITALAALLAFALLAGLSVNSTDAMAKRALLIQEGGSEDEEAWLTQTQLAKLPEKQIEGACGLAVESSSQRLYVSDYYHRAIDAFSLAGLFEGSQPLFNDGPHTGIDESDAVCGLAVDAAGNRYGSELHQAVVTLPGEEIVDPGPSTGVAVDEAGNLYVDDRTYVALYDAPVMPGEAAAEKIGLGDLVDAYGVAVDSSGGRVYVADAATDTIKVFEPAVEPELAGEIDGPSQSGFSSLRDAAVAVDTSEGGGQGHLLVVDNVDPGAEKPGAAIYEFDAGGNFLGALHSRTYGGRNEKLTGPLFGEPSGLAVDPGTGDLYVTTGNSVKSNVLKYGPFEPSPPSQAFALESAPASAGTGDGPLAIAASPRSAVDKRSQWRAGASTSVIVQRGPVRVKFDGRLTPHALPRHGTAPVGIAIDASIAATGGGAPPQLRKIAIAINRHGRFETKGLPVCRLRDIQPSTTANALAACRSSLVGEGHFSANVKLPEQSPFPSAGKILAFNGRLHGKPVVLAHIYGTEPAPTSTVLPFLIEGTHGTYGTVLEASLPEATGDWGYVTGLRMTLRRSFDYRGKGRSYLSAGCPAPAGFPSAVFPLARTSFGFAGGLTLVSVLDRSCRAKG